jgi:ABC-type bacteriocin/lantibiotic exporter with double-glycine peptidase domain
MVFDSYKDKFEEQELGVLISKIVKLPIVIRDLMYHIRNYVVPLCMVIPFVLIWFSLIDKKLGIIVSAGIATGAAFLIPKFMQCIYNASNIDHDTDLVHEEISELFDNMLDIYSMDTQDMELRNLENQQNDVYTNYRKTSGHATSLKIWTNVIVQIIFLSAILYTYHLYRIGKIDTTKMVNVAVTSMYIIGMVGNFASELPAIVSDLGTYIHVQKYLEKLGSPSPNTKSIQVDRGEIVFRNVSISYGTKQVLKNFDLVIAPGESVAIIGRIGSGKSSLAKALLRLVPYTGTILVDDQDIAEIDPGTLRSQILYVPQNPLPFNRSLYDNIAYGNPDVTKQKVIDLFHKYNLETFFGTHDLDQKVGKKGSHLSGGQRQMIFLLRVMLSPKSIIILDEPTSSLDDGSSRYVMRLMEDILHTKTVILITHDSKIGSIATRKVDIS